MRSVLLGTCADQLGGWVGPNLISWPDQNHHHHHHHNNHDYHNHHNCNHDIGRPTRLGPKFNQSDIDGLSIMVNSNSITSIINNSENSESSKVSETTENSENERSHGSNDNVDIMTKLYSCCTIVLLNREMVVNIQFRPKLPEFWPHITLSSWSPTNHRIGGGNEKEDFCEKKKWKKIRSGREIKLCHCKTEDYVIRLRLMTLMMMMMMMMKYTIHTLGGIINL